MDALQSYGNDTACPSCVHVDPGRLDFHIDPGRPRMNTSILRYISRRTNRGRFWRHTARYSFQLLAPDVATNSGIRC